jgi:hypothetical protein
MWPDHVPLLATVYQDYIRRYGLELSVGPGYRNRFGDIWDDNAFFIETASLFTEGAQIGRIRLKPRESNLSVTDPSHKEMVDFLGKVVARYKHDISRNYLVYGQLRRPLTFTTPSTMPMIAYKPGGEFAALMSGVFRTDDGSIGVFIANASRDNMEFSTTIDRADYSLPDGNLIIQRVSADGGMEDITHDPSKPITLTGNISGHDIVMFRIAASK